MAELVFNSVNAAHYKTEETTSSEGSGDVIFAYLEDGDNNFRVLPPWSTKGLFAFKLVRHYNIPGGEKPGDTKSIWCAESFGRSDCPICSVINKWRNVTKLVEDYDKSYKYVINAILYDKDWKPMHDGKPVVLQINWGTYSNIRGLIGNPMIGDVTNPITGSCFTVNKSGSGQTGTKYGAPQRGNPIRLWPTDAQIVETLAKTPNLDIIYKMDAGYLELVNTMAQSLDSHISVIVKETSGSTGGTQLPEDKPATTAATTTTAAESKPAPVSSPTTATATPATVTPPPATNASTPLKTPDNAPACFGGYLNDRKKCTPCIHEVQCINASKAKG